MGSYCQTARYKGTIVRIRELKFERKKDISRFVTTYFMLLVVFRIFERSHHFAVVLWIQSNHKHSRPVRSGIFPMDPDRLKPFWHNKLYCIGTLQEIINNKLIIKSNTKIQYGNSLTFSSALKTFVSLFLYSSSFPCRPVHEWEQCKNLVHCVNIEKMYCSVIVH